jgi:abortive infection bacteriophage resistance protein
MAYAKPYLPVPNQLALIKGRGMVISDDALAETYLNKIGYYRLSGYWYPYRKSTLSNQIRTVLDDFREGTKFSEIVDLYVFDKKLRLLMMDVIERIEIALRVQITLQLGKQGPSAHRDPNALHPNFARRANPTTGEISHRKWLRLHDEAFDRSKEEFAKHFKTKYPGEDPPIWIAAELWDFGSMSMLYSGMRKPDQTDVAKTFGINSFDVMTSWLRSVNVARNICAHHSRFWNKPSVVQPKWPPAADCPDLGHVATDTHAQTRVYGMACVCAQLLKSINPKSQWVSRFKGVIASFPKSQIINLKSAGFPDDWDKANMWN